MDRRKKILISTLALSFLGMVVYLSLRYPEQSDMKMQIFFGIALITSAIFAIKKPPQKRHGIARLMKILFATHGVIVAIFIALSITLMLFPNIMPTNSYGLIKGIIYIVLLISLIPFVSKKLT